MEKDDDLDVYKVVLNMGPLASWKHEPLNVMWFEMMDMVIKKRFVAMKFTKQNLHILKVLGL
jgi:hypothetical protein